MDFPKIFSWLIFFKYTRTVFSLFFIYENLKGSIWRNNFCRLLLSGTAIDRIEIEGKTLYAATAIKCQVFANFQKKKIFLWVTRKALWQLQRFADITRKSMINGRTFTFGKSFPTPEVAALNFWWRTFFKNFTKIIRSAFNIMLHLVKCLQSTFYNLSPYWRSSL